VCVCADIYVYNVQVVVTDEDTGKIIECYVDQDVSLLSSPHYTRTHTHILSRTHTHTLAHSCSLLCSNRHTHVYLCVCVDQDVGLFYFF